MLKMQLEMSDLAEVFAPYRETLAARTPWLTYRAEPEMVRMPVTAYLDETFFKESLGAWAEEWKTTDLKLAAAMWNKYYSMAVAAYPLALMSLGGVGVNVTLENVTVCLSEGKPKTIELHDLQDTVLFEPRNQSEQLATGITGRAGRLEELHEMVYTNLFRHHFEPLIERVYSITKLSRKVMWGNLGVGCFGMLRMLTKEIGVSAAEIEDTLPLFSKFINGWVADGPNPLYEPIHFVDLADPALPEPVMVRRSCCLYYKLGEHAYCGSCPILKPPQRIEIWKNYLAAHS